MSSRSETLPEEQSAPWSDIETLLDAVRVEEEAHLAVLEALAEVYDPDEGEFSWDLFYADEEDPGDFSTTWGWFHP